MAQAVQSLVPLIPDNPTTRNVREQFNQALGAGDLDKAHELAVRIGEFAKHAGQQIGTFTKILDEL